MSKRKFRTFDDVQIEHYRKHPAELKSYLRVALEEAVHRTEVPARDAQVAPDATRSLR